MKNSLIRLKEEGEDLVPFVRRFGELSLFPPSLPTLETLPMPHVVIDDLNNNNDMTNELSLLDLNKLKQQYQIQGQIIQFKHITGPAIQNAVVIMNQVVWYNVQIIIIDARFQNIHHQKCSVLGYLCKSSADEKFKHVEKKLTSDSEPGQFINHDDITNWHEHHVKQKNDEHLINNPDLYFQPGDVIKIKRNFIIDYYHFGIYIGNKELIHIGSPKADFFQSSKSFTNGGQYACITDIKSFMNYDDDEADADCVKSTIKIRYWALPFRTSQDIIDKANELVAKKYGQNQYDLIKNNCEHFAMYCATGKKHSSQSAWLPQFVAKLFSIESNSSKFMNTIATSDIIPRREDLFNQTDFILTSYVYNYLREMFKEFDQYNSSLHRSISDAKCNNQSLPGKLVKKLRYIVAVANKIYRGNIVKIDDRERYIDTFLWCAKELHKLK